MKKLATDWGAHVLQVALFSSVPFPLAADFYSMLLGVEADSTEDRPKEGTRRQAGVLNDVQIQVGITPLRLDVVFSPPPQVASLDVEGIRTSFGPFGLELEKFSSLILEWVPKIDVPLVRVAFICAAVAEAPTREDVYNVLGSNLKSLNVSPKMEDLLYRVNWKAPTESVPEGFFNRLTTWSAFALQITAGFDASGAVQMGKKNFARLDVDINTPAERREPISRDHIPRALKEMFQFGLEIVENGEPT